MPTPYEALINAAEACEAAAQAHDSADQAIKLAYAQKTEAAQKAEQAIRAAQTATQRRVEVGRGPSVRSIPGDWSEEQREADLYRYKAKDCREAAKLFET